MTMRVFGKAVSYISGLKPTGIILKATDRLEMPLAAALQAVHLPVIIVNPRQARDFNPGHWCSGQDRRDRHSDTCSIRSTGDARYQIPARPRGP